MAQLAISLAGGIAGGAIAGPFGARVGFLAGSILGRVLFPEELPGQRVEGPRLGDLSVTASTYGQAIPKLYGTVRLGGNCFWATDIEEVRNISKTTSGGKGGSEQSTTTTTYSYFGTFAIGFCEGVADDVIRIWADGKLIYDKSTTTSVVRKSGLKFRFYNGSETQLPDSLIEADVGTGQAPAHRGMVYIVFDSLPLADYGNRRPNITAEIAMAATPSYPVTNYIEGATLDEMPGDSSGASAYDFERKRFYLLGRDSSDTTVRGILVYSVPSMVISNEITSSEIWSTYGDETKASTSSNYILPRAVDPIEGYVYAIDKNASGVLKLDPNSLNIVDEFGLDVSVTFNNFTTTGFGNPENMAVINVQGATSQKSFLLCCTAGPAGNGVEIGVIDTTNMSYVFNQDSDVGGGTALTDNCFQGKKNLGSTNGYVVDYHTGFIRLHKITIDFSANYDSASMVSSGVGIETIFDYGVADFNALPDMEFTISAIDFTQNIGPHAYDEETNSCICSFEMQTSGSGDVMFCTSIDADSGVVNWIRAMPDLTSQDSTRDNQLGDLSKTTKIYYPAEDGDGYIIDKFTGELLETFEHDNWFPGVLVSGDIGIMDYDFLAAIKADLGTNDVTQNGGLMYFDRASGNATTLSDIVSNLSADSGLSSSDIDVTDLTDTTVLGYMVARQTTVRGALEPLSGAYFFDAVESDYKIKYLDRGGASSATIEEQDLASVSGNDYWVQERSQEQEMPMRMTVQYMDFERDYQEGTQSAKRAQNPFPTMYSRNETTIGLPIVLDDSEAKQIVEKMHYNTWQERDGYKTNLSWEYLKLDPADVVTVNFDDGTTYEVRLTNINFGANLALDISALSEETANYTSSGITAENNFTQSVIEGAIGNTFLIIHNVPLLSDTHDQIRVRSILYAQAGPYVSSASWTGATIYQSTDQVNWQPEIRIIEELTYGSIQNTLAAPSDVFAVDTVSSLTVWPTAGGDNLSSVTYAEFLTGENNIMIIGAGTTWEVVNFQNATDNGDGSYTIDTFLRGRRGTDTVASSHSTGEYFYLVDTTNTEGFSIPLANIDSPMYFKAVGNGQTLEEAPTITITPTGEDLKPYAPVNATRTDNSPSAGDITFAWDRRTRINGDGSGAMPLNEDSESYSVDVLDGPGGSVVRTLSSSSESVEYDSVDIASDFGVTPNPIYVRIYQVSAQVGRGKSYEWELYE